MTQGDIIRADLSPTEGHEQNGFRPLLIVSNRIVNKTGLAFVCPITNNSKRFPTRIPLDERTDTEGSILTDQVRTIDLNARNARYIERCPADILDRALQTLQACIVQPA